MGEMFRDLAAALVVALILAAPARAADPDAIWKIVHDQCVPDQQAHGDPRPCAEVDLGGGEARGHAVLKDQAGATQFLLIPTARIVGIESPELLAPGAPDYFAAAWRARSEVEGRAGKPLPRDAIGLAINSITGRSQQQLHIHIDCVKAEVRDALRARDSVIGDDWRPFQGGLEGHPYQVRRLVGDVPADPFALLAEGEPGARTEMGRHTLAVLGAQFADGRPGFYLLDDRADLMAGDRGSGEELLDRACAVAHG